MWMYSTYYGNSVKKSYLIAMALNCMDKLNKETENPLLTCPTECPICLIPMTNCLILPCKHRFHIKCISEWAEVQDRRGHTQTCPICRGLLLPPEQALEASTKCCCF